MIADNIFNQLMGVMERYFVLPPPFKPYLRSLLSVRTLKRGDYLFKMNEETDGVFFICSGCFQENTYNPVTDRKEPTWYWYKDYFIFTTPGFFSEQPCECDVIALMDSTLIFITRANFEKLKSIYKESNQLTEMIRDKDLRSRTNHGYRISHLSVEEIVLPFYKKRKMLFNIAKKKDIARFLAIEYDTLRRILKKIR